MASFVSVQTNLSVIGLNFDNSLKVDQWDFKASIKMIRKWEKLHKVDYPSL